MKKPSSAFSLLEISAVIIIFSIILIGVATSAKLIRSSKLGIARGITQDSEVSSIKGLILWLDTTAEGVLMDSTNSSALDDGDAVQTWSDQNPQSANKFALASAIHQPTYIENGINNLPTLYFNADITGTNGNSLATSYSSILNPSQFTIFTVVQPIKTSTNLATIVMSKSASNSGYALQRYNSIEWDFLAGDGSGFITQKDTNLVFNSPYIISALCNGASSSIFGNGLQKTSSSVSFKANTDHSSPFIIGNGSDVSSYFDGYISEIIMFERALTTDERQSVEEYLAKKYAIKLN